MKYLVQPLVAGHAHFPGVTKNKTYTMASVKSGMVASVRNGAVQIEQRNWNESKKQQWKIEALSGGDSGYFRIVSVNSGKVLDVSGGSTANGAEIVEWSWHGGHNQQWRIEYLVGGRLKITSRKSGLVLDVKGGSVQQGAPLIQYPWHGSPNQQWHLSTVTDIKTSRAYDARATIYEHGSYQGRHQAIGVGSYDMTELAIGNDTLSSLRVPDGLQVTLYEHAGFRGRTRKFTADTPWVGDDFNDIVSSVCVEMVATIYEHGIYQGRSQRLGLGMHNITDLAIGNDTLSSLKVPQGLMVTLYEHADFGGRLRSFTENTPWVGDDFNDITSSIVVKTIGIVIPNGVLKYGDKAALKSHYGTYAVAEADGRLNANRGAIGPWEEFVITRSGASKHTSYVSYGDTVSLRSIHGYYVAAGANGQVSAFGGAVGPPERFTIVRAGTTLHNSFVTIGDTIALRSTHARFLAAEPDGTAKANRTSIDESAEWTIRTKEAASGSVGACGALACAEAVGTSYCGAQAAGVAFCGQEACGANACGAAACLAAATLVGACGAAAAGIVLCGADFAGVSACEAVACGAAACGADLCAGAACAAAACAAAACGAAACGGDACGADACGVQASVGDACAAEAGAIDACPLDACAANACAINLCPADACLADACALDLIPIIPFI